MKKNSLVRTIYLYLFAIIGLCLLVIGAVRFIDMGLKAFIFTKADQEQRLMQKMPFSAPYPVQRIEKIEEDEDFSDEEKALIKQWLVNYKQWEEESEKVDYITTRRHQEASGNLAMILVGLPLYLYHWGTIRREIRERSEQA